MTAARALLAALLVVSAAASPARALAVAAETADTSPSFVYIVKPGDTLLGIAERGLITPEAWKTVAQINRVDDPHHLPIGKRLIIPAKLLRREPLAASIAAFSGQVRLDPAGTVAVGTPVKEGTRLQTGANSFVTLALADGSHVTLPSQSIVRVETLQRVVLDGHIERDFRVESGRADFGVTPRQRGEDRFLVRTPVAVAAVRGTEFRVAHLADADPVAAKSVVSVVEGSVASRSLARPGEIGVAAGTGAVLGSAPTKTAQLLPPPVLEQPGKVQDDPEVTFRTAPMPGVRRHVELARDAGFVDRFAETETAEDVIRFAGVGNGTIYVRLAAIDADGIEGLPASYAVDRFQTGLSGAAETAARPRRTLFRWQAVGDGSRRYDFVLARDAALVDRVIDAPGLEASEITATSLSPGIWYWRVSMTVRDGGKTYTRVLPVQTLTIPRPQR